MIFFVAQYLDQNSSMCDIWLGFGSPSTLSNWSCDANHAPIQPVCSWAGITCDSNNCGTVMSISVIGQTLSGTISSSVGQLTSLINLDIENVGQPQGSSSLGLYGTLPSSIASLSNLQELVVNITGVNGTIPSEYNLLTNLTTLRLSQNLLTGTIPDMFYNLQSVVDVELSGNLLTGNVPPSICALVNLNTINITSNKFSCYPTCLLNAPNPGNTLPVADPNALIPGGGGATYGSKTGNLTQLTASQKSLDPVGNNTCTGNSLFVF